MNEKELCLYVVTQDRLSCLNRMLASVVASSRIPDRILIITPNKALFDSLHNTVLRKALGEAGVRLDVFICTKTSGLAERKNMALRFLQKGKYHYGLSVDDDMVFDPHCIERMVDALEGASEKEIFAVGPTVLQQQAKGLPDTEQLRDSQMAVVEDGTWKWRGFIQGIADPMEKNVWEVDHLAGCYAHRILEDDAYDTTYDRPGFFLHESDFLFKKGLLAVKNAVVHHWPPFSVTLWDSKNENKEHILKNTQYFAKKHKLGIVEAISWEGFEEVDNDNSSSGRGKSKRIGNSRAKKRNVSELQATTNDNNGNRSVSTGSGSKKTRTTKT